MNDDTDALNQQPPEKPNYRDDGVLDVFDIWHTIQGEGPDAGTPAVFIRLAGCNLACPNCDADYTSKRKWMTEYDVSQKIQPWLPIQERRRLVVFTGGEPFRQQLTIVADYLLKNDHCRIQIETNGTLRPSVFLSSRISIICSPKTPLLNPETSCRATAFKYVLEADYIDSDDGLPTRALGGMFPARPSKGFDGEIFVQPCDEKDPEKNKANQQAALNSCMKFGYRLSLQTHKILGLE